jgi:hypothetical protein
MTDDLIQQLMEMAASKHDDLSVAAAAAQRIEELEKAASKFQWQPIEAAPRDGTHILCYNPRYGMILNGVWSGEAQNCFEMKDERLEYIKDFYPTHWMPLPEPPKGE